MKRYVLGVTGASGSAYAERSVLALLESGAELHLVFTREGERVFAYETGRAPAAFIASVPEDLRSRLFVHDRDDLFAPIASGSFRTDGMAIVPCSMSSAAAIACGTGGDLLRRAADVHLKERRTLVVVPRETPLSSIHLRNLLTLSEAGAVVLPACPAFYGKDASASALVDFVVGRTLSVLGVPNSLYPEWSGPGR